MIYIESDSTNPYYNLALEEYVFEQLNRSKEYFMLWQNANTIVIGKYQNTSEEINQDYVDAHQIRVARRLSGGGAVYHDEGNLNYTLIVDQDRNPDLDFRLFILPVIDALKELGVEAAFTGRNDLTIAGRKFSGSSQYAKGGRIMHHGCIMLDTNAAHVQEALRVKEAKFTSKSIKSVRSRITTINEHAPERIPMDTFKTVLRRHVMAGRDEGIYALSAHDREAVARLARDRYETWEWNYGKSPACEIRRERKYDFGLVCVDMSIREGCIADIHLSGDFFGNGDLRQLEKALTGLPLDEQLTDRLSALPIEEYIRGMTPEDLSVLLR